MSRILEALRRAEGAAAGETQSGETPPPSSPRPLPFTLDEYPHEAGVVAERRARADETKARQAAPTPFSSGADRIVSTAQRVDARAPGRAGAASKPRLVSATGPAPHAADSFRRLAAALQEIQVERGIRVVMITGAVTGEGTTFTAANLALTLAESQTRRVLLIDADPQRPSLHHVFSTPNTRGLSQALAQDGAELPLVDITPSLSLLPSGHPGPYSFSGVTAERLTSLLEDCAHRFDWVVIDSAPVGVVPEARILARLTRAVVFVIGARSTPAPVVERAVAEIGSTCIVGTVMNRMAGEPADYRDSDTYTAAGSRSLSHRF